MRNLGKKETPPHEPQIWNEDPWFAKFEIHGGLGLGELGLEAAGRV
jgi:hypothetical protein